MNGLLNLLAAAAACAACWKLLGVLIPQLQQRLLDQPNERSAHSKPTPRGGGMAFVLITLLFNSLLLLAGPSPALWIPWICAPLAVVGLLDDRLNLPALLRYGIQILTAIALLLPTALPTPLWPWLCGPLVVIAVTAVINFVNFTDGLDGLVAGCMTISLGAIAINGATGLWPLVGALAGFLIWNWAPAKVFMGDVGSTFLGAVFAGMVLQAGTWPQALALLLLATPLLADACLCVIRRAAAGQRIFQAHRLHLFQRLHQAGWPHQNVAGLYVGATAVLAVLQLSIGLGGVLVGAVAVIGLGLWLDQKEAVPFA
ncbi:UDP-N-acetylmuramyl pentapeptidephosphotransferase/UDP-N-acetylglucosamine-1-phosphatetransferase [Synechococcus sp. RCC307]|nr:UDP-N-acetylmuramyl pentapeptidephosphotransferase/UDP-N-acetylglucosamine-1-phosphatetransferase [Synechococcus sp. RCC307]